MTSVIVGSPNGAHVKPHKSVGLCDSKDKNKIPKEVLQTSLNGIVKRLLVFSMGEGTIWYVESKAGYPQNDARGFVRND